MFSGNCFTCNMNFTAKGKKKFCSNRCKYIHLSIKLKGIKRSKEVIKKMKKTFFKKGHKFFKGGEKGWFKRGHIPLRNNPYPRAEKHPMWKGGRKKSGQYIFIHKPNHPFARNSYVLEHRLIMENHLGRYLRPEETVHHINHNSVDNRIENLMFFKNNSQHLKYHREIIGFKSQSKFSSSKIKI